MTPEARAELLELAKVWRERSNEARARTSKADAAEGLWAGKCIALTDCAEHLEWLLSTRKDKP